MKRLARPADAEAAQITFGVELETKLPRTANVAVGGYHSGLPVRAGISRTTTHTVLAPTFHGTPWRADRDGSIQCQPHEMPCEFVSPILHGEDGLKNLRDFIAWVNEIGATVDQSCGLHITVGVESIIGTRDAGKVSEFARKLAHICQWHAMSLYGQTGTGRHLNRYSATFSADVAHYMRQIVRTSSVEEKRTAATHCGRGMVNFQKLFTQGVIEFRVFAGTLSLPKIMHHLATVLGLCRRAHQVQCLGGFKKNDVQARRTITAAAALKFLHDYLGWRGSSRPVALGIFGLLVGMFPTFTREAQRLCKQFDERFPDARL
jgi:hypothetical protein